ncbi:hypothetical protein PRIPAC_73396 [Pristionchus pacificus]|uniref:Uncharacterized protein n=1 Tax=Pristionchus pacificus TaxID=54126 RepID=A0A2A6C8H4_PRIPA|nr:hypothetical protein PRIPAC_73396 [Pristionchus pacificus]|eukprot:PDM74484.1 hypothetical protein PRIPAC_41840 [Pristionchus pacificus]
MPMTARIMNDAITSRKISDDSIRTNKWGRKTRNTSRVMEPTETDGWESAEWKERDDREENRPKKMLTLIDIDQIEKREEENEDGNEESAQLAQEACEGARKGRKRKKERRDIDRPASMASGEYSALFIESSEAVAEGEEQKGSQLTG